MRSLTKSGILKLLRKYCFVLNILLLMFMVKPSFAVEVATWEDFKTAIATSDSINLTKDIIHEDYDETITINRKLTIYGKNNTLGGNGFYPGINIGNNGVVTFENVNICMFMGSWGAINNTNIINKISGNFKSNGAGSSSGVGFGALF